jgi:head-tail adaptor
MPQKAGLRDRKIQFLQATVTKETGSGVEVETFAALTFAWAQVFFGTGSERREASAAGGVQSATFRCLSTSTLRSVTRRDLIVFDNVTWGISSISTVGAQGHEIEFTATVRNE